MEDSGYLPRLAALSNRMFKALGLNGKAVLPMVLGLGCVTMATLTTRVMESKRERLLVTLLLALAVPCSAQLGVVMGMLAGISLTAALIWGGVVLLVLLAVGWLAARLVPGERTPLIVELPPLRLPMASNVVLKTLARLEWYIKEVIPLFLVGTFLMFILDKTGMLEILTRLGEPLVTGWLGLPAAASAAFLMGFLRRDFGATGLFMMQAQGLLNPLQVVVAMVTITLFIPCIASVLVIAKEQRLAHSVWHDRLDLSARISDWWIIEPAVVSGGLGIMNTSRSAEMITCSMCGHIFDPQVHLACQSCPLQKGCQLVCCPACGYEMVDIRKSALAQAARRAARWLIRDRLNPEAIINLNDEVNKNDLTG